MDVMHCLSLRTLYGAVVAPFRGGSSPSRRHGARRCTLRLELLDTRILPSFLPPVNYDTGGNSTSVAIADLNGDGIPDLVTANDTPLGCTVSALLDNGDGTFQSAVNYQVSNVPYDFGSVAIA